MLSDTSRFMPRGSVATIFKAAKSLTYALALYSAAGTAPALADRHDPDPTPIRAGATAPVDQPHYSHQDLMCAAKVATIEAKGLPEPENASVVRTMWNRATRKRTSICAVVRHGYAPMAARPSPAAIEGAENVLYHGSSDVPPPLLPATGFRSHASPTLHQRGVIDLGKRCKGCNHFYGGPNS